MRWAEGDRTVSATLSGPRAAARARALGWLEVSIEETTLRRLLWQMHPCDGKYGDDGEMQCPCGIDFRRDTVDVIERKTHERGERILNALAPRASTT